MVGFGISNIASPKNYVGRWVADERLDFGGEKGISDKGGGVVVFGGEEDDKEELEVFLCEVECLCVSSFEERQSVASVFLLKFAL